MIDKVGAIILRNKQMLVVREKGMNIFYIPGGTREGSENDEEVLKRNYQKK